MLKVGNFSFINNLEKNKIFISYSQNSEMVEENIDFEILFQDISQLISNKIELTKHEEYEKSCEVIQKAINKRYSK